MAWLSWYDEGTANGTIALSDSALSAAASPARVRIVDAAALDSASVVNAASDHTMVSALRSFPGCSHIAALLSLSLCPLSPLPQGQNLALNIAEKGFNISVWNRSHEKTVATVDRAKAEGLGDKLVGFEQMADMVASLQKPRAVIMLVQAGRPVDAVIAGLADLLEPGDLIIDGGNEMYTNTQRRQAELAKKGLLYMGMGVSGGEEGARHGPSMMPGGPREAYERVKPILEKVSAQVGERASQK